MSEICGQEQSRTDANFHNQVNSGNANNKALLSMGAAKELKGTAKYMESPFTVLVWLTFMFGHKFQVVQRGTSCGEQGWLRPLSQM